MCILLCAVYISASCTLNSLSDVVLENLTVVPDSPSSVELEWKVVPTDGHHCIRNYNIQITSPNGSQWEVQIPGSNHSLNFTGLQLIPFEEYTYCVTANLLRGQIDLKLTANFTELQGWFRVITKLNKLKVLDLSPNVQIYPRFRSFYETLTFIASCLVLYYSQLPL